ncbi:MAG: twin-arginine translocase TatA/TatE family subunit [Flavobacteriales bacterium]|nr:twin-arginine translocase TatA/TatE family subunit [Flavobacteriales bacterium]
MKTVLLGLLGTNEIILIAIVLILMFGAKKIPQLMRGVGSGIKEFKDGMKEGQQTNTEGDQQNQLK